MAHACCVCECALQANPFYSFDKDKYLGRKLRK
jgi:hypothetical protein